MYVLTKTPWFVMATKPALRATYPGYFAFSGRILFENQIETTRVARPILVMIESFLFLSVFAVSFPGSNRRVLLLDTCAQEILVWVTCSKRS